MRGGCLSLRALARQRSFALPAQPHTLPPTAARPPVSSRLQTRRLLPRRRDCARVGRACSRVESLCMHVLAGCCARRVRADRAQQVRALHGWASRACSRPAVRRAVMRVARAGTMRAALPEVTSGSTTHCVRSGRGSGYAVAFQCTTALPSTNLDRRHHILNTASMVVAVSS